MTKRCCISGGQGKVHGLVIMSVAFAGLLAFSHAHADGLRVRMRSDHPQIVQVRFFSEQGGEWPGPGKFYTITDNSVHQVGLRCNPGEKICFGAWSGDRYWGTGKFGDKSCSDCCWMCGGDTAIINLR